MAVVFDAVSSAQVGNSANNVLSWTHTPVGVPSAVAVGITLYPTLGADTTPVSVTYGAVSLTRVNGSRVDPSQSHLYGACGASLPTGPQTVTVTFQSGDAGFYLECGAITVTGSDTTTCFSGSNAVGNSAAISASTTVSGCASGDLLVDICAFNAGSGDQSPTGGQTLRWGPLNASASGQWGAGSTLAVSSTSVVSSWAGATFAGNEFILVAATFKVSAAGPPTVLLGDRVLDNGLLVLDTEADKMFVCAASPTSYADATSGSNSLGSKNWGAGAAFGSPAAKSGGGRQITSTAVTDGTISTNGTVAFWAAVDSANSRLLASGSLSGGKAVTVGQVFTLGALTFGIS